MALPCAITPISAILGLPGLWGPTPAHAPRRPVSSSLVRPERVWPPPSRTLASEVWGRLPALLWRALHPLARERFVEAPAPAPLPRLSVPTRDGWTLPVWVADAAPGASGEPVLLLAPLGASVHVFRYGLGDTLVDQLRLAGFAVYLVGHRIGADAEAPAGAAAPRFDDVVDEDLPAAVAAICVASGYPRVHVLGHGFGGQVALAWAARSGGDALASLAVISAPIRFPEPPHGLGAVADQLVARLPSRWRVPVREVGRWRAARVEPGGAGARRRGAMTHTREDVSPETLREVRGWMRHGALVDRDGAYEYASALARVRAPLWMAAGAGDSWCPPAWALPLRDAWRGGAVQVHTLPERFDHLDSILHPDATACVHTPLIAWMIRQRVRAWREGGS